MPQKPRPTPLRTGRPAHRRLAALALLALGLAGCGHHDDDGDIFLTNYTDQGTPEQALTFRVASFGDPFTGDLLGGAVPAGSTRFVGEFDEDYYDAQAEMELGDLVEWFDVWVEADDDTFFDIF